MCLCISRKMCTAFSLSLHHSKIHPQATVSESSIIVQAYRNEFVASSDGQRAAFTTPPRAFPPKSTRERHTLGSGTQRACALAPKEPPQFPRRQRRRIGIAASGGACPCCRWRRCCRTEASATQPNETKPNRTTVMCFPRTACVQIFHLRS